uniref:AlNc14C6G861 protein n=1 Tax=Albugo laibachii Nc14 TaxID=890382 RepID=F0W192_9STRA|nr:AlNc14C6G861 [Albugo laibachii Nc14]|eukprot:CCA14819.1 AlNc14C6G861 [Albugo laibachii Nc14]
MILIVKDMVLTVACDGLHIGILRSDRKKISRVNNIFKTLNANSKDFAKTYKGSDYSTTNDHDSKFSNFIKKQLSSKDANKKLCISITALCTDLAKAIKQVDALEAVNKIKSIYWSGGFAVYPEKGGLRSPYNWAGDIKGTEIILQMKDLNDKISIVSRESHPYGFSMDSTTFHALIEEVTYLNDARGTPDLSASTYSTKLV